MVLEPKFTDYGSIQSSGEAQQQSIQHNNNSCHVLLSPPSPSDLPTLDNKELCKPTKGNKMTQGDLYQRQPLLSTPVKGDQWGENNHPTEGVDFFEDDEESVLHKTSDSNGIIKINIPAPVREEPKFPQEKWKTLIGAIVMFFSFLLSLASLSMVHERLPDPKTSEPLPDIFLDSFNTQDWALSVSEYIIVVCVNSTIVMIILHKHRFIILRRMFLLMSLLYMYRAVTMYVTVLPIPNKNYACSPKANSTAPYIIISRMVSLFSGFGLTINGKQVYCGDSIFSGHTVCLVISYLFISEYTPKKLYLIHWVYWLLAVIGVIMLELARGHYTIDVIIAYYITSRLFWIYHTLANNSSLKQHSPNNYLGRLWWYNIFVYFEGNVGGPVPRQWPDWPLPWPRKFQSKSRES